MDDALANSFIAPSCDDMKDDHQLTSKSTFSPCQHGRKQNLKALNGTALERGELFWGSWSVTQALKESSITTVGSQSVKQEDDSLGKSINQNTTSSEDNIVVLEYFNHFLFVSDHFDFDKTSGRNMNCCMKVAVRHKFPLRAVMFFGAGNPIDWRRDNQDPIYQHDTSQERSKTTTNEVELFRWVVIVNKNRVDVPFDPGWLWADPTSWRPASWSCANYPKSDIGPKENSIGVTEEMG
ncbi:hypothetical protein E3N88_00260 [Mikania micrantha]|uniref:Uncharacterized protein n=1 Tax=Mikania micrantha TaxID=192012 RepID=A0A5N6PXJ3_9ASTR|nr:hypothetical protein E3N88_00260 [Mikania micrantha]